MIDVYYAYKNKSQAKEMLFYVLKKFHGVSADENSFVYNENGKPRLKDGKVYFNVSHTKGLIMIAVSDREVGIDVENFAEKKVDCQKIAEKYFFDDEIKQISAVSPVGGDSFVDKKKFFILWTKKESAIKYAGLSLASSLKTTSFKGLSPIGNERYDGATTQSFSFDDHVYSVTSPDREIRLKLLI